MAAVAETSHMSTPAEREVHIERIFAAPRDCVWRAFTEPELIARWWGRGHQLDIERHELERGGHWRFVEHGPEGLSGFEGRYREVTPPQRISETFDWDGMPGYVSVETATFEDLGDGRTRLLVDVSFHTAAERDGMLGSGMQAGMDQSYAALDEVLATLCP
jgi:uncharacterized protein YndB with AHSA1/START domain